MEVAALFAQQLRVMMYKQYILAKRHWVGSIIRILIPSFALVAFWLILRSTTASSATRTTVTAVLPKCIIGPAGRCATMVYAPDTTWTREVVQFMASQNGLNFERDFIPYNGSSTDLPTYMLLNLGNITYGAVYFHIFDETFIQYEVFFNRSTAVANSFDLSNFNSEQYNFQDLFHIAVERAISTKVTGANYVVSRMDTPEEAYEDGSFGRSGALHFFMQLMGLPLFYLGLTSTFVNALNGIVAEKHKNLRGYLRTFGLMESVHWLSWFLESFIFYQLSLLLFLAFGYANSDFLYFRNSNFFANYFIFTVYGIEVILFAFLTSLIVRTPKAANFVVAAYYLVGMIATIAWGLTGRYMFYLYGSYAGTAANIFVNVLDFFPFWRLGKSVADVQDHAVGSIASFGVQNSTYYSWSDMSVQYNFSAVNSYFDPNTGRYTDTPYWYLNPSTSNNLWMMILIGILFYVLAWYLDNIISDTFGARRSVIFFTKPSYWGIPPQRSATDPIQNINSSQNNIAREEILRINGLSKKFGSKLVVNDLNLEAESGSVVALLGHNGAGKTTTINILTGLTSATRGSAFIAGYNVSSEIDVIRSSLGICPQFDVYWTELTAYEHLYILYHLKQHAASHDIGKLVSQKLIDVRLSKVGDHQVGTFSGGMRRRLSVALSTIGEPKLIILDEPTTGIDPANRQYIWRMIKELKSDRLILLTTHSMEEADFLGDKVAIMSNGSLQCVGSPLHLKGKFGTGYRVHLTIDPENADATKFKIHGVAPQAQVVSENAGSIVLALPRELDTRQRTQLFDFLQQEEMIKDWGLSNTTLEDVFLQVTRNDQWNHQHQNRIQ